MPGAPSYAKPPVLEALVDIRVDPFSKDYLPRLEELHGPLKTDYPKKKTRHQFVGTIQVAGQQVVTAPSVSGPYGYWFESEDQRRIVQLRLDGFTYNRIKPDPSEQWPGWAKMREEARQAWDFYVEALGVVEITRLAVRYINRIVIPHSPIELNDYFTAPPQVPSDLRYQELNEFFGRVSINIPDYKALAILMHAPAQESYPGSVAVTLDIDVSRGERAPVSAFPIWETLDQLRDLKNIIFEASLRPRTKELFK